MYGNNIKNNIVQSKLFPYIFEKLESEMFSFRKCIFKANKEKDGTSRNNIWRLLKVPGVYTMETSLCGGPLNSNT